MDHGPYQRTRRLEGDDWKTKKETGSAMAIHRAPRSLEIRFKRIQHLPPSGHRVQGTVWIKSRALENSISTMLFNYLFFMFAPIARPLSESFALALWNASHQA